MTNNDTLTRSETMNLVKTLENGNKVFSVTRMEASPHAGDNGQSRAVGYHQEIGTSGEVIREWQPTFEELAIKTMKRFGN